LRREGAEVDFAKNSVANGKSLSRNPFPTPLILPGGQDDCGQIRFSIRIRCRSASGTYYFAIVLSAIGQGRFE
jgi:hypothetical protein